MALDNSVDQTSLDPVLTTATQGPSPQQEKTATIADQRNVQNRIAQAAASGPSVRQSTQSEVIDLELARWQLGNPFSTRWIPFQQLREMTTDLMLAFGWYFTITPIVRAEWGIDCPDAQLAAAVDAALRPVITNTLLGFSNALWFSHQPLVKRFKLGQLSGSYRDPNGTDPDADVPVWTSSADALLWKPPATLNPSHCLPQWNEDGEMIGFKFSSTPIPHAELLGMSSAYGYTTIPGQLIGPDYAMWLTNEADLNFGSVYGSARTKRAYPYWWSYWFRWRLADRAFETHADPAKLVYYPTQFDQFIDPDDPDQADPVVQRARDQAILLGEQTRSGATLALPGDFTETPDGKSTGHRKWEISYLTSSNNFTALDDTFRALDVLKLRSWFLPENALIEGKGSSSGGGRNQMMAVQLGELYQESQQLLVEQYDAYISDHMIPQFIAANFPEKVGTPCRKSTRTIGVLDEQTRTQLLTLIGQVRGEVLPVDTRKLLEQMNVPLLNQAQFRKEVQEIATLQAISGPPEMQPEKVGTQGYNAGVVKTEKGTRYMQPPERLSLAESDGFVGSLPDTPHYRDAVVRSAILRLRRVFLDRYEQQYSSLADFLEKQPTLHLAQAQPPAKQQGLTKRQAQVSAAAIITAWAATQAPGAVGHAAQVVAEPGSIALQMADLVGKIALAGGKGILKGARLDAEEFGVGVLEPWVQDRVKFALDSIDATVRNEAEGWLTSELEQSVDPKAISEAARTHFEDFPATHASRVAQTETRDAFNRGTLTALDLAGVTQVQAHDASNGADAKTDAACLARDAKVYSVQDAMNLDEHPYGTLYFTPLSTERLSLERVDKLPTRLAREGLHVAYDPRSETLYLLNTVDEHRERAYMAMLGDQLSY